MEGYTSALLGSRFKRQERKRREAGREESDWSRGDRETHTPTLIIKEFTI